MIRPRRGDDSGFTLLELLTTMLLFGIIVAIGAMPYRNYQRAQAHAGSTRKIVAILRNAQVRSVAEASTYRVVFAPGSGDVVVERKSAGAWQLYKKHTLLDPSVVVTAAGFNQDDGTSDTTCYFYPRGSASKGAVVVGRSGKGKTYNVSVEGLTARVSYA